MTPSVFGAKEGNQITRFIVGAVNFSPHLLRNGFRVSLLTMLDWSSCRAVERVPGKVSGAWVFRGTRVPVSALFENLEGGATIDEFMEWFPGVTRQQVEAVLEHTQQSLQTDTA